MEFFFNKEKDQVMKTKEKLCQKQLFRNLQYSDTQYFSSILHTPSYPGTPYPGTPCPILHAPRR